MRESRVREQIMLRAGLQDGARRRVARQRAPVRAGMRPAPHSGGRGDQPGEEVLVQPATQL